MYFDEEPEEPKPQPTPQATDADLDAAMKSLPDDPQKMLDGINATKE